jgi:hypothetical protein
MVHSNLVGSFLTELGLVWIYAGRRDEARRCLVESAATSSANAPPAHSAVRCAYEGLLLLDEGDSDAAWRALDASRELGSPSTPYLWPLWALAATRVGRSQQAEAALTEGRPADSGRSGDLLLARWAEAEAWRALGRQERVEEQEARFFEVATRLGCAASHPLALRLQRLGGGP